MKKYDTKVEALMLCHYKSLGERGRRHYAAVEAVKLGFGGRKYICELFGIDKNTVRKGILELHAGTHTDAVLGTRQRVSGGGRKPFFLPNQQ
jgi:hypothetical protein